MFLDRFHSLDGDRVRIAAADGSRFAKEIAGDFNPIHDPGSRPFCIPGDLLCALVLRHYGLSRRMQFRFRGMVGENATLVFPRDPGETFSIVDERDRAYLDIERSGPATSDPGIVEPFVRSYVAFSGRTFPHILQPLLARHGVMFNPDRPLVMYDTMGFSLDAFIDGLPEAELADAGLEVQGKRAEAVFRFDIRVGEQPVGHGSKRMVVSGLRPYDEDRMQELITEYERRRAVLHGEQRD